MLLGNIVPHLHVHVVPRYLDDSAPGMPLPWAPSPVPDDVFDRQFTILRDLSRQATASEVTAMLNASSHQRTVWHLFRLLLLLLLAHRRLLRPRSLARSGQA
jgi:hypothetical protein